MPCYKKQQSASTRQLLNVKNVHMILYNAPVAQLDRVPGYEPGGREFESLRARHLFKHIAHNPVMIRLLLGAV